MKAGRKPQALTEKEAEIMQMLWRHGRRSVRQLLTYYSDPKPHYNTVATTLRILESKGFVAHDDVDGVHCFYALADMADFRRRSIASVIRDYFNNSYSDVVSALVEDEKISVDELREIIDMVEKRDSQKS